MMTEAVKKSALEWSELPLLLTPRIIQERGIYPGGRNQLYALFHRGDFPAIRHGKKLLVGRDAFRAWLEAGHR